MDQQQNKDQFFNPLSVSPPQTAAALGSEMPKKKLTINKNFFLVGFFLLILAGLVYGLNRFTGLFSKAAGECFPESVKEADLSPNSVDILFSTNKACQLEIAYGTGNQTEALLLQVPESMASLNHRVRLSPLLPATTYYYQIKSEGKAVGTIRSFLTLASSAGTAVSPTKAQSAVPPTAIPTTAPITTAVSPAVSPATSSGTAKI
ncbi:hypothetical protein CO010_00780, partial [Candidatus Shapirobacteria bacterium CG_4_8_14_3_um_filter_39_11]